MGTFRGGVVAVYKDIQYFGLNKFNTRLHKSLFLAENEPSEDEVGPG